MQSIEIAGTGLALPPHIVYSTEIDQQQNLPIGRTEKTTGVASRHYVTNQSASEMAVNAIYDALENANLHLDDIDCIIAASGTMEQMIPCNAAKIHEKLPLQRPIPAFDINMTCLSAVQALDMAHSLLHTNKYKTILVVSSDIASIGLDWRIEETGGLFGDGAAAMILRQSKCNSAKFIASHFETFSDGSEYCQIRGLGTLNHPNNTQGDYQPYSLFEMHGKAVVRLTTKHLAGFVDSLFAKTPYQLKDMDWVVPHQASKLALRFLQNHLDIDPNKIVNIMKHHGNQIAASIPSALHELLNSGKVKKGDKIMLLGTSAGLSFGAVVLEV
ncbi:3-oxoacyl-[acyl-carrier-protein] synthase III C-terminal domain-containing protein [Vibrio sp.]|uniref:3-oxoacyl-[acyl-carrier-protein] synthase III C-terminal domain-containing protein n=1 Tax=Vibrio sp. TaxID=678 RepID=UPI003F6C7F91